MRLERYRQPLLSARKFRARLLAYGAFAAALVLGSLGLGMVGYHFFARLSWLDSFLNASMILTGMGPVDPMRTVAAKIWAAVYAIFSGVAFLGSVGVLLTPVAHRLLHRFHLEEQEGVAERHRTSPPGRR